MGRLHYEKPYSENRRRVIPFTPSPIMDMNNFTMNIKKNEETWCKSIPSCMHQHAVGWDGKSGRLRQGGRYGERDREARPLWVKQTSKRPIRLEKRSFTIIFTYTPVIHHCFPNLPININQFQFLNWFSHGVWAFIWTIFREDVRWRVLVKLAD